MPASFTALAMSRSVGSWEAGNSSYCAGFCICFAIYSPIGPQQARTFGPSDRRTVGPLARRVRFRAPVFKRVGDGLLDGDFRLPAELRAEPGGAALEDGDVIGAKPRGMDLAGEGNAAGVDQFLE